jgi:hypothetical protein
MTEEGLKFDGEIIAWAPENSALITEAARKLRATVALKPARKTPDFETLLERFQALNSQLEDTTAVLDERQRRALGEVLLRLSDLSSHRGVVLVQR